MEGPILAEFSSLNALSSHKVPGYGSASARTHRSGSRTERSERGVRLQDDLALAQRERLLRGESSFTGVSSNGGSEQPYFEDQPQNIQYGVSNLLPKAATAEERERLMRRLDMCAKAREESTKIMSIRFAQRDAVKTEMRKERLKYLEKLSGSQRDRDERWSRKLQRSPFAVDLVAENQRIDEENRVQRTMEQRRQRLLAQRSHEAHDAIFKRATAETDELDQLRAEKRQLLENERQLKALKDVERSNARTAQILQERRRRQIEKEQQQQQQGQVQQQQGQQHLRDARTPPLTAR